MCRRIWEENQRKSEESEEIWEESQETEGKRGGTKGKGQREAVEEERAGGAEKNIFLKQNSSEKYLKTCIFSGYFSIQFVVPTRPVLIFVFLSYKLGKS